MDLMQRALASLILLPIALFIGGFLLVVWMMMAFCKCVDATLTWALTKLDIL